MFSERKHCVNGFPARQVVQSRALEDVRLWTAAVDVTSPGAEWQLVYKNLTEVRPANQI